MTLPRRDPNRAWRVVIAADVPRDERLGSAKVPLREARELERLGLEVVTLFSADLPATHVERLDRLLSPLRMALCLIRRAANADVVDVAGSDMFAYAAWARRFRPRQALVTRSNGLWYKAVAADGRPPSLRRVASRVLQTMTWFAWEWRSIAGGHVARFVSTGDAKEARARGWVTAERAVVVPPGCDTVFAATVPLETRSDVGFAGTWLPRKGSVTVVRAFESLLSRHPNLRARVLGSGVPEAGVLAAFAPQFRDRISVKPHLSPDEMASEMKSLAILLFPTRYEGFGMVVAEAMRCGVAVVTTGTGAGEDIVKEGRSGFLVPVDNPAAAAAAVERLLVDDALRCSIALGGIEAASGLTWERTTRKLLECYQLALALAVHP